MEIILPEPSASPRSCNMAEGNLEGELVEIGNRILLSASSLSLSAEDLSSFDIAEEEIHGSSPSGVLEDDTESETESPKGIFSDSPSSKVSSSDSPSSKDSSSDSPSSKSSTSDSEAQTNSKSDSQWRGFLRKLKKGPRRSLHTFHPNIPSIKKMSKKKSRNIAHSMPALAPHLDAEFYCFEASWINFSLLDLQNATNNFSHENLIGEGGYSEVYKGHLDDGKLVAVKRLTRGTPEEMTSDFLSELGILVHVSHPNIANVIGYGVEGGMHLVLPLSPHGSLASLLTGEKEKLEWGVRYNIALGTASALSFLHEGCHRRIIHRDIKAANILLTEDFEPQISDFGLAKWLPDQWTHLTISQFEGTFGYLPPEFFLHGIVDEKTDVYAYGVLLLELITGRPALDKSQKSLVMWAKPFLTEHNIEDLVDPFVAGAYDSDQMNRMVLIASMCIYQSSTERPQMSQVIRMLKGYEGIYESRKKFQKRPAFKKIYRVDLSDEEHNSDMYLLDLNQHNQIALEL